ncbi:MAG: dihydrodipicolinate synthase family protein [Bryobacterales bacterium]|jgi:4-hydroxy-2-oxoglutarate aldolase|nr:dihydrodipicolinate synthase family protein [Bryobacterales bacterium]
MIRLQGIFPPLATPFNHEGDLYPSKVKHNVEKLNRLGLAGYVVGGSTGESVLLSHEEKLRLWGMVAEATAPGKTLIAGTGVESVRETAQLCREAAEAGYQVAMVRTPHYYRGLLSSTEAQVAYFRAVADQSPLPVLIYNFPQATMLDISPEAVIQLSEHPNLLGIKESSGSMEKVMRLVAECKPGFQVLVGSAPTLYPSLQMGACGAILAFANAAPYAAISIWEAFRTRQHEAAADWQDRIRTAARLVTTKYGIPGLKHAMDLNGYYGGPPRLPLVPSSPGARAEIEDAFRELKS